MTILMRSLFGAIVLALAPPAPAEVVSARDFGAVGDGIADDTAALQAALDAVAARGGGTVEVPAGTYVVAPSGGTTWLRVGSDTTLRGAGESATVFRVKKDAGDYRTIFGQASPAAVVRNVRFAGFRVDQNAAGNRTADVRAGQLDRHQNAIFFSAFDGLIIEGVAVDPATGVNTFALNGVDARGAVIRDCRVRFAKGRTLHASGGYDNSAIYVHGAQFIVSGNRFENGGAPGDAASAIEVHGGPGGVVTGNQIAGYFAGVHVVSGGEHEPVIASNDLAVVGNTITGAGAGIQLWALTGRALRNVTISGNGISLVSYALPSIFYAGIALRNDAVGGQVLGDHEGIVITGNAVSMARERRAGYSFADTAGILAAPQGSVRSLVVANNVVRDSPSQGLRVESKTGTVTGLVVQGNVIVDAGHDVAAGPYRIGMIFAGKITAAQVRGNVLVDTGLPRNGLTGIFASSVSPGSELQLEGNSVSVADPAAALAYAAGQDVFAQRRAVLAFGASVRPDATQGRTFTLTVTSPTAFSLEPATGGVPGQRITIHLKNGSGGAMGRVTWRPGYRLAGGWVSPAAGHGRLVEFEWDGTSWVETSRSAADVPN